MVGSRDSDAEGKAGRSQYILKPVRVREGILFILVIVSKPGEVNVSRAVPVNQIETPRESASSPPMG